MRDAGRQTAPVRDSDVLVETARAVRQSVHEGGFGAAWESLVGELESRREAVFAASRGPDGPFVNAGRLLGSVSISWPDTGETADRDLLRAGLATSYESVRAHGRQAFGEGSDAKARHELRKRAKDLRHQVEFLNPIAPATLQPLATDLHHLSDLLGDANDLIVLARYLDAPGDTTDAPADGLSEDLVADVNQRCQLLWDEARLLAKRLFRGETGDFVRRVEDCWVRARPLG
jgi:CHAD domain-containing protein